VNAGAACFVNVTPEQVDNGSYDPDQDPISFELSPSGPYNVGTTPVVLTVNDTVGGGVSVATATITVVDTTPPVITGEDIVVNADPGQCGAIVNHGASATDNCGSVDFSCSHNSGSLFPIGTTTVTCVAVDQAGHVTEHSFTVTVEDNEAPAINVADIVAANAPGQCGAVVSFSPAVTDNCGVARVTTSHVSGSAFPVGSTPVIVTATDVNGNVSSATFNVTVNDIEAPVIVPITQPADLNQWTSEPPGAGVWTVDSSGATVLQSINGLATFFYSDFGALSGVELSGGITVKTTGDDDYIGIALGFEPGDTSDANADYLLIDWKQNTQSHPWGTAHRGLAVSRVKGVATDANFWAHTGAVNELARGANLSSTGWRDLTSYTFTFDYSATSLKVYINGQLEIDIDAPANDPFPNGRFAFYNFSQSHVEYQGVAITPTLTDITIECNTHGGATNVDLGSAIATDNCDANPVIANDAPAFFPLGSTLVTWTATDAAGNATTILQNVTVVDNTAPVISGLADLVVANTPGQCDAPVDFAATTEDCSPVDVTYSIAPGSAFPVGSTPVTVTATDASGNSSVSSFTVTVTDTEAPVITAPADIVVNNDPGACGAAVEFGIGATDNCGVLSVNADAASGDIFPVGTTTVNIVAADIHGNAGSRSFNVTVIDAEAPAISIMPDITVSNDPGVCGAIVEFDLSATDNCGIDRLYSKRASGSLFPVGTSRVTIIAYDVNGNHSVSRFNVTVIDTEAPVFAPVSDITVSNAPGACSAVVSYAVSATDNCDGFGSSKHLAKKKKTATQKQKAEATQEQQKAQQEAATKEATMQQAATAQHDATQTTSGSLAVTCDPPAGSSFPVGSTTVTCTATDSHGNTSVTTFTVTVTDDEAPAIATIADISVVNDPGVCGAAISFAPTASDNCGIESVVTDAASGSLFPVGATTVNITATDIHGNESTSSFNVTVADNEAPAIATIADISVDTDAGVCGAAVNYAPTASDNCAVASVATDIPSGYQFPVGTTPVTVTATDIHGNSATSSFNVTVTDNEAPVIAPITDISVNNDAGQCSAVVSYAPAATDNCGVASVSVDIDSGTQFPVGSTTVTITATDIHGNNSTSTFTVTVTDNEAPVIAPIADIVVGNDAGVCGAVVAYNPTATDNCEVASVTTDIASGTLFEVGTTTVTITAIDIHGNSATSSFSVTVEDLEAPVIDPAAADLTVECDGAGNIDDLNAWLAANGGASATDNCGIDGWSHDFAGLTDECGATGSATVTFTATDIHGNSSSTSATFTIVDTTAPELAWAINGAAVNETDPHSIKPNEVPVTVTVTASDLCGGADINALGVTFHKVNGAGKIVDKTDDAEFTIVGGVLTILDSAGVGTIITITSNGIDDCGNISETETMIINVVNPGKGGGNNGGGNDGKGNEGVGNGVDGDTPGHDNNGGNDDPGTGPGNPGAKGGKKKR